MEINDDWISLGDDVSEDFVSEGSTEFETTDNDPVNEFIPEGPNSIPTESDETDGDQPEQSGDLVTDFLKSYGIADPSKLVFEDDESESGTKEVDFNSLPRDEQMNILKELTDPGYSQEETSFINYIRSNNLTIKDYINSQISNAINRYQTNMQNNQPDRTYTIDDYSDDELYVADLKSKYPDFTDDELIAKLDTAKENEDLFKKEVSTLRDYYKNIEDEQEKEAQEAEELRYQNLQNQIMNAVANFNEVSLDYTDPESDSLMIEDADKQQMLAYILNQDAEGKSQLTRDLENPESLIQLAWLRTQGNNIISGMTQYWKDIVKDDRREIARLKKRLEKYETSTSTVVPKGKKTKINDYNDLGNDLI